MSKSLLFYSLIAFVAAFGSGAIVVVRRWSDEHLHYFLSFGAGIFLGTVFGILLPESIDSEHAQLSGIMILAGFMLLFFVERFLASDGRDGYRHTHEIAGVTAFIGLSVHSLIDGAGLALAGTDMVIGRAMLISILAHKIPAAIALSSLLILAEISLKGILFRLFIFAAATPFGALIMGQFIGSGQHDAIHLMTGVVTGSFLYVAIGKLLPEVFHGRHKQWVKLLLLMLGICAVLVLGLLGIVEH